MKKIVGIIAALALASAVFADAPVVEWGTPTFSGNATFGWKADFDKETHGMYNTTEGKFGIQWSTKGSTSSAHTKDLWGELAIEGAEAKNDAANAALTLASATKVEVKTAKIHFIDSDDSFFLHLDILKPSFKVGGIAGALATDTEKSFAGVDITDAKGLAVDTPNGFTLKFGVPVISFDVAFGDNGADATPAYGASDGAAAPVAGAKTKSVKYYSFKVATTIKPVDGLEIGAGIAMSTTKNKDKLALAATVKYTYTIDGELAILPAVSFSAYDMKNQQLGASLLFKWGASGKEPGFLALKPANMSIGNKCTSGASVYFTKTLDAKDEATGKAKDDGEFGFAVYDNTLLSLVGEDAGNLNMAAKFTAKTAAFGKGVLAFAVAYDNTFMKDGDLPIGFTAKFSFGMDLDKDAAANAKGNTAMAYSIGLTQKTLIENTELHITYTGSQSEIVGADNAKKGAIDIGCKISL